MTALTFTVTLSLVMMSWGGTSSVTVRRPTLTARSMIGHSRTSPGPFSPITRPSRNTTRRSYSRTTRIALTSTMMTRKATKNANGPINPIMTAPPWPRAGPGAADDAPRHPHPFALEQDDRAEHHRHDSARRQQAMARHLDLGDEERHGEHDQGDSGVIDRQGRERQEREDQADPPHHAGQDGAGVLELEQQPVESQQHENVGDVGIGQHAEQVPAQPGLDRVDRQPRERQRTLLLAAPPGASVRALEQLAQ